MNVSEITGKGKVEEITLTLTAKEEPRDVRGGSLRVCNATGKDDSGEITVTLWNDDIDKFQEGDKIKITNGWAQEYNNALQISSGKFGAIEKVGDEPAE